MCLSVCPSVCWSIISKSSQPISMNFDRMVYNDKSSVSFEYEINRLVEEHTSPKRIIEIDIKPTHVAIYQKVVHGIV